MSVSGVFGVGSGWGSTFRTEVPSVQRTATATGTGTGTLSGSGGLDLRTSTPTMSLDVARERLGSASAALRNAFGAFSSTTRSTYIHSLSPTLLAATAAGLGARLDPFEGGNRFMRTTVGVNTQTSTDRSSSVALGLDLATGVSALDSAALGLDTTSAAAASRLDSSAALGLDLTSPDAASALRSSAALGLDTTSAQTASSLKSSATLGLDTSSAEAASSLKSSAAIGLDTTSAQSASTIVSTAEVDTAATSYAPSVSFSSGTTVATLSGTFTGVGTAAGATSLKIKTLTNVTLDSTGRNTRFQVIDQNNTVLLDYNEAIKAGDKIYLGDDIGLYVSFSAGTVVNNATGTSAVTHSATNADAAAIFNNSDPNLRPRFDNGAQVVAGSFTINGTSIAVNANDSINAVIARINGSAAGVTASFANDKLTLTTTGNSEDHIYLANDTSGFLAAMKLAAPSQEINAATTSYGSNTLAFGLGSTSVGTLSGTYTGVGDFAGATSLTIKMKATNLAVNGTASTVKFDVLDQGGHTLFSFNGSVRAGDKIALANDTGLWISFSAGTLLTNATAATTVSTSTKTDVDAAATFNNSDPNLRPRFENSAQVTAGSFQVNGTSVAVNANDSINSVIARINATVSGVTASFANDKITIVNNAGSNPVVLSNDTSGFLAATKLAAAVTTRGNVRDDQQVLAKTTQFASVASGAFTINGVSISVNKDTDTVSSLVSRINSAGAGVTASYDSAQDKLVLTGTSNSEDLITVAGDSSGFLTAAKLSTNNTVRGNLRDDQQVLAKTTQFASVASGSFTINGVSISVNKDTDSVSSLVSRINSAGAGVTASYDSAQDKLVLTGTSNSEDLITVAGDTSGFLTAAKLSTNNTVRGNIRDDQQVLSKTSQFGSVASGSFTINGVSIAVNKDTDTVSSLVSRINSAGAGVTASYDSGTDKLVLTGTTNSEDLITVANDTTGFLSAAHLQTSNTVRGHIAEDQVALANLDDFQSVTNGSFQVDGKTIAVDVATDSVQSVVDKINASGARVSATYDTQTDKIKLQATYNSEDNVPIANDTSGFLAAAHLAAANTVKGNLRDDQQVLSKTSQFGSVASGSFTINGQTIAVDAGQDSVSTLVDKINGANAGVTASFNAATNKIQLVGTANSEDLISVANDTTGFLAAAGLNTGNTVRGKLADNQQALSTTAQFGAVTNGSFNVNGVSIAVDAANDTLETVIGKINGAGAGVTASYSTVTDKVTFTPDVAGATLTLDGDTTGFLAAARVATGTVGTHVNADAAFNATGANGPLLDPGVAVQAGSFTVNGVAVAVAGNDTIKTVLGKITASNAGVTATYDDATQAVTLRAKTFTEDPIVVANDTSGFLAAVKLDGTVANGRESISAFDGALGGMAEYSGVQAGTITVNGQTVAVDPATTTIRGLVSALNGLTNVSATLDDTTGKILIGSQLSDGSLTVADTSGVLAKLGVAAGKIDASVSGSTVVETTTGTVKSSNAGDVAAKVSAAIQQFNQVFSQLGHTGADVAQFRKELKTAIQDTIESLNKVGVSGLTVSGDDSELHVSADRTALANALNGLSVRTGPGAAIEEPLDRLTQQVAAIAVKAADQPAPRVPENEEVANEVKGQLTAHQALASMMFLKPLFEAPNVSSQKAADAYGSAGSGYTGMTGILTNSREPSLLDQINKDFAYGTSRQTQGAWPDALSGASQPPAFGSPFRSAFSSAFGPEPDDHQNLLAKTWDSWNK